MGCGGSRADAIEPRYHESWTRETESTWLTNTDAEIPIGVTYKNRVARGECSQLIKDNAKLSGSLYAVLLLMVKSYSLYRLYLYMHEHIHIYLI